MTTDNLKGYVASSSGEKTAEFLTWEEDFVEKFLPCLESNFSPLQLASYRLLLKYCNYYITFVRFLRIMSVHTTYIVNFFIELHASLCYCNWNMHNIRKLAIGKDPIPYRVKRSGGREALKRPKMLPPFGQMFS